MTNLERALDENRAPWTEIEFRSKDFWVFRDAYPVTPGHLLFVPTEEQSVGEAAGQTVMYPHVHMIPRRKGDMDDPRGGVRHVIPEKGNYRKEV